MQDSQQQERKVSGGDLPSLTNQAGTDCDKVNCESSGAIGQQAPTKSSRRSRSFIPYLFDPRSSAPNEDGDHTRPKSLIHRLIAKLHLSKSYLPGHIKGEVDQIIHSLDEYCSGYGKVAAIEDLDQDFLIFRKYGWLRNYALLHLQDELAALQVELVEFDKWDFRDGDEKRLVSRRLDYERPDSRRKEIIAAVHCKLKEYGMHEALLRTQKIQAIKRPSLRSQRNVHNLIHNTQSLVYDEADWIREGADLAALGRAADRGWLNTFLENLLNTMSRTFTEKLFRTYEQKIKTGSEALHLVSLDRLDNILRAIITVLAAILLLVPIFILFKLQRTSQAEDERKSNYQILVIFIFTLLFSASCSIFTQARRQEVFAATAAYSAVLVVFLGNTSNI